MKHLTKLFSAIMVACLFSACSTTTPIYVNKNPVGDKKGESSNTCIFAFGGSYTQGYATQASVVDAVPTSGGLCFNTSDYGIKEAATDANIKKVATVDLKYTWYVFWSEYSLIVTGK